MARLFLGTSGGTLVKHLNKARPFYVKKIPRVGLDELRVVPEKEGGLEVRESERRRSVSNFTKNFPI